MPAYEYLAEESITPKSLIDDTNPLPGEVTIELDDIVVAEKIPPLVVKKAAPPKDGLFKSAAKVIGNQVSNLSGGIASAVTMGIFKWGDEDSVAFIAADWLTPVPQGKIGKALKGIRQLTSRTKKANKTSEKISKTSNKHVGTHQPFRKPTIEEITGFKDRGLKRVRSKSYKQNGGGKRTRWIDKKGRIYEHDSLHDTFEV